MVAKIKELIKKHRELVSYVFFGGLTTAVSIAVNFICAYVFKLDVIRASTVSWIFAVTFAFLVNKIFVFQNRSNRAADWIKQAAAFYGARLSTYFLEIGYMYLTVEILEWYRPLMIITVQFFILVGNYILSKFFIFRKKK